MPFQKILCTESRNGGYLLVTHPVNLTFVFQLSGTGTWFWVRVNM